MASIWNLPVIFYCINNGYGISADIKKMTNIEHIHERSAAYGIPGMFIPDGNNVIEVYEGFQKAIKYVRSGKGPVLMGEDVGIFGGDFGTSVGMLEEFGPERVRDCPIS